MGRKPPTFRGGIISVTTYAKHTSKNKVSQPVTSPIRKIHAVAVVEEAQPIEKILVGRPVAEEAPDPEFLLLRVVEPEKSYCNIQ